jgi:hypothetical protein
MLALFSLGPTEAILILVIVILAVLLVRSRRV